MTELSVLVNAKLRPAVAPAFAIERPVLVQRLRDLEGFRLALVVAPAGYGKSVLLSQWYEQDPSRIAWLTVDERDRDPVRLGLHLLGALSTVEPTIGARAAKVIAAPGTTLNDTPPSTPVVYRVQAAATTELIGAFAHDPAASVGAARAEALAAELLAPQSPAPGTATLALAVAARDRGNLDEAGNLLGPALAQAIRWRRWPLATLMLAELALVDLARGAPRQALRHLDRGARMTTSPLTALVADRYEAIGALAWAALGERREPHRNRAHGYNRRAGWELSLVEVVLAIDADRPAEGAAIVASWPTQTEPMGVLERELAVALVERASGDGTRARHRINLLLDRAEDTGLLGPFLLGGRPTVNLLTEVTRDRLTPHTEMVLTTARRAAGDRRERPHQLSDRELEVLNLLPSRLSNAEMAQALFVSTNTVKTHLKHIYQKLGAVNRDEAIRRARDVGLL